ncbi:MAG: ABC transporter permease [Thermobispora bispora]|nr:ABC transporter permease [Thermobispora bispora]
MTRTRNAAAAPAMPSALRLGLARGVLETKLFFREKDAVVFTFAFPIVLLVLFGAIFSGEIGGGITITQLYVAGFIGAGVLAAGFQNLGIGIAADRERGTLKRLAGTPMPRSAYFIGKVINVLVVAILETAALLAIGVAWYGIEPPREAARWAAFAWIFVLGVTASTLLGIAVSSVPRSAQSAAAVITLPSIVLQFISGVFIPIGQLPEWLTGIAAVFPLKWMCQGFRWVFLGDAGAALEPAGTYELDRVALVLGAWIIGGLVLCLTTFRWQRRGEG